MMAKITVVYGAHCLDSIDDIDPAKVLEAGDKAVGRLASRLGHDLRVYRMISESRGPAVDVESRSRDRDHVERRLRDRFEAEWQRATDRAIEDA
jgi:hypothetical protein